MEDLVTCKNSFKVVVPDTKEGIWQNETTLTISLQ
jgi:hypothetical protein